MYPVSDRSHRTRSGHADGREIRQGTAENHAGVRYRLRAAPTCRDADRPGTADRFSNYLGKMSTAEFGDELRAAGWIPDAGIDLNNGSGSDLAVNYAIDINAAVVDGPEGEFLSASILLSPKVSSNPLQSRSSRRRGASNWRRLPPPSVIMPASRRQTFPWSRLRRTK